MKILYVSTSAQPGGAELCLLDMMAEVRRTAPEWDLAMLAPGQGPLVERARALGVDVRIVEYPERLARLGESGEAADHGSSLLGRMKLKLRLAAAVPAINSYRAHLRQTIAALRADVIHTNGLKANLLLEGRTRRAQTPVIWHLHDYLSPRPLATRLARRAARRCALAIANSESVANDARPILQPTPVRTLYNAIDLDEFSPAGERADLDAMCELAPAASDTLRIGLVCTMAWWKGQKDFLRALSKLDRSLSQWRGYIIGGPIYKTRSRQFSLDELRHFARELGIAGRIGFTDFTPAPAAAMRALDVVVHASSEPEPFGRVIVEAQACEKPVITSGMGGAGELITPDEDALVFPSGDAAALAGRIRELINDRQLRERLGGNGLRNARRRFDCRRLGPALTEIYQAAQGGAGREAVRQAAGSSA